MGSTTLCNANIMPRYIGSTSIGQFCSIDVAVLTFDEDWTFHQGHELGKWVKVQVKIVEKKEIEGSEAEKWMMAFIAWPIEILWTYIFVSSTGLATSSVPHFKIFSKFQTDLDWRSTSRYRLLDTSSISGLYFLQTQRLFLCQFQTFETIRNMR